MSGQRFEQIDHSTRHVTGRHHQRSLVAAGWCNIVTGKHEETCCILRIVLDIFGQQIQSEQLAGTAAGNRRATGLKRSQPRGFRITGDRFQCNTGKILIQPFMALRERLCVRIELADRGFIGFLAQQIVVHRQSHFAADVG